MTKTQLRKIWAFLCYMFVWDPKQTFTSLNVWLWLWGAYLIGVIVIFPIPLINISVASTLLAYGWLFSWIILPLTVGFVTRFIYIRLIGPLWKFARNYAYSKWDSLEE